ncbi:MAG: hypothetical protein ACRDZO_07915 [Egibacteraceae bacterium]
MATKLWIATRDNIHDYAARLSAGAGTIQGWEDNPSIIPTPTKAKALDALLRRLDRETVVRFALLVAGDAGVWVSDSLGLNGNGEGTDRNQALRVIFGGLAGIALAPLDALGEALQRITETAANRAARADAGLATAHEDLAEALTRLYHSTRPEALAAPVARHADLVLSLLDRPSTPAIRQRLGAAAVSMCAQAGLLAFQTGDHATARRYFALGRSAADDSGNETLCAQMLGLASIVSSALPRGGQGGTPTLAAHLLDRACTLSAAHSDGLTRLWLAVWRADEAVAVQDLPVCRASLDAADRAPRSLTAPERGFFSTAGLAHGIDSHLATVRARTTALSGRHADAEQALIEAVASADGPLEQVVALTHLAMARIRSDQPEAACQALTEGLDLAVAHGYVTEARRVCGVHRQFPAEWVPLACVADLGEHLRFATA